MKILYQLFLFYCRYCRPLVSALLRAAWIVCTKQGKIDQTLLDETDPLIFEAKLLAWPYKSDPGAGFFDFTIRHLRDFFRESVAGRDCDDFASMWYWWANKNKKASALIAVAGNNFRDWTQTHVFTLAYDSGVFLLLDYRYQSIREKSFLKVISVIAAILKNRYFFNSTRLYFAVLKSEQSEFWRSLLEDSRGRIV